MKIQIRNGVFETNSSSVHSITMCPESEFEAWKNGEYLYYYRTDKLVKITDIPKEELEYVKFVNENMNKEVNGQTIQCWDLEYLTYEQFNDWDYVNYETYHVSYKTESGETIVAFGYFGHD